MIDFLEALRIAEEHIEPECALLESAMLEKPYGWYFYAQSKEYIETGDILKQMVGSGGFLVERESGRILNFSSADSVENWLKSYEKGFKYEAYDLTVSRIYDLLQTVQILAKLGMQYVIPEWEDGVEWKISKFYTEKELRDTLSKLPYTFRNQSFRHRVKVFEELDVARCCEYLLSEHITC
jgi:hypothetical protein